MFSTPLWSWLYTLSIILQMPRSAMSLVTIQVAICLLGLQLIVSVLIAPFTQWNSYLVQGVP